MRQVIHIHIPRTAGRAMMRWAERNAPSFQSLYTNGKSFGIKSRWRPEFDPTIMWSYFGHSYSEALISRGIITQEWFDSCFKFTFVRNTWERLVSLYRFNYKHSLGRLFGHWTSQYMKDFDTYVGYLTSEPNLIWPRYNYRQLPWLNCGVNFIGRCDKLHRDWKRLCVKTGTNYLPLPYQESKPIDKEIGNYSDWRKFYTKRLRRLVANFYADEIERFSFKFS